MLLCVFCLEYSFLMSAAILSRLSQFVIYRLSKLCTCFVGNKLYETYETAIQGTIVNSTYANDGCKLNWKM